jgi:peptide/nickel transport system ATP-binding protein
VNIVECTGLWHAYPPHRRGGPTVPVLRGVDLAVGAGERVALVGRSGSGKSTLVQALLALQPTDAGTIRCHGRPVVVGPVSRLRWYRKLVQYVPQDPWSTLDPRARVMDLVAEPVRRLHGVTDRARLVGAATAALEAVGLSPALGAARAGELSGGQAQRVAIARALCPRPALLLADEPVSGLDAPMREQVVDTLRGVSEARGTALLLVSHDLSAVAALCTRVVVLHDGRIVEDRPAAELLRDPRHPETRSLLAAVPRLPA